MGGSDSMIVSLRLNDEDTKLFRSYAKLKKVSLSELFRSAVMGQIEDEYDLSVYHKAIDEFEENPITYSLDEVERISNINT